MDGCDGGGWLPAAVSKRAAISRGRAKKGTYNEDDAYNTDCGLPAHDFAKGILTDLIMLRLERLGWGCDDGAVVLNRDHLDAGVWGDRGAFLLV